MLSLIIWWSGIGLEAAILIRASQQKLLGKYPFFYLYVASLFMADGLLYILFVSKPAIYPKWNWDAGFLNILLSSGILLEIFKHVLGPYPGAERFARRAGLAIFALVFTFAMAYLLFAPANFDPRLRAPNLERNLLSVEAIFLSSLIAVIYYYGIPLTRNLGGMIVGYGLCVATTLMTLALRTFSVPSFNAAWIIIQPLAYWMSLLIWLVALWNYSPSVAPVPLAAGAVDYESLASTTRSSMGEMRSHLGRAARP